MNKGTLIINGIDYTNGGGGGGGASTADAVSYDNSTSGLTATNVQEAIDEQEINLRNKQDSTDIRLETNNKTVVGGINEVNESLTHKTMYGTSSEFDAIKDDASIPIGSAYDITDDYEESSSGKSEKIGEYSSAQTITVDLSKYKSIGFGGVTSGYVTNIVNIPMDIFMSDTTVAYQNYYQAGSSSTQYYVSIKYVDSTHIQITRMNGFTKALIFGVM